jgi:dTDP-4-dehydrorhamnose 3,5-epimerase
MIEITASAIAGVRLLRPVVRSDARGLFVKTMAADVFALHGIPTAFAEQYYSVSHRNVLRGLHFQTPPHDHDKLVTCIEGAVFDVVVDLRAGAGYGRHETFELSGDRGDGVFVPRGCAHGFYVRSEQAIMLYNVTTLHAPSHDTGIRWDSVGVAWPSQAPVLSERDAGFPTLAAFKTPFVSGA